MHCVGKWAKIPLHNNHPLMWYAIWKWLYRSSAHTQRPLPFTQHCLQLYIFLYSTQDNGPITRISSALQSQDNIIRHRFYLHFFKGHQVARYWLKFPQKTYINHSSAVLHKPQTFYSSPSDLSHQSSNMKSIHILCILWPGLFFLSYWRWLNA